MPELNKDEFLACSGIPMWAEILIANESFLPDEAAAAYVEMTKEERHKEYEASAFVTTGGTLQLYGLRITASGSETEHHISRWSLPLRDVRLSIKALANDWGTTNSFEEVQFEGELQMPSAIGIFPQSIQLPLSEKERGSWKARKRARVFMDHLALKIG